MFIAYVHLYYIESTYIRNFKPLASLCSWAGRFESHLVATPEDRISRDAAHMLLVFILCMALGHRFLYGIVSRCVLFVSSNIVFTSLSLKLLALLASTGVSQFCEFTFLNSFLVPQMVCYLPLWHPRDRLSIFSLLCLIIPSLEKK